MPNRNLKKISQVVQRKCHSVKVLPIDSQRKYFPLCCMRVKIFFSILYYLKFKNYTMNTATNTSKLRYRFHFCVPIYFFVHNIENRWLLQLIAMKLWFSLLMNATPHKLMMSQSKKIMSYALLFWRQNMQSAIQKYWNLQSLIYGKRFNCVNFKWLGPVRQLNKKIYNTSPLMRIRYPKHMLWFFFSLHLILKCLSNSEEVSFHSTNI